ncbi:unnamed protein product [Sphagnum balticum]
MDEFHLFAEFARQQVQLTLYSYNVLRVATKDFHHNNKLGQGGFGVVYKGILSDGTKVAVKHLTKSQQGVDDFLNEVIVITGVRHRNLVKLKGCCVHGTQRFLVFEYMENNNLAEALWDRQGQQALFLDWPKRLNICVGVARGLAYLHEDSYPRIIHRDIKASNILLDKNMNAKIADFGLARLFPDDQSHLSTQIGGTIGYLAPEYATLGQLTPKVDVYSFGILLLEIVSGRKNINSTLASNKIYLVKWAWSLYETNMLINLVDQDLDIIISENEMKQVIFVALLCVQIDLTRRPMMSHVMAMLQGEMEVDIHLMEPGIRESNHEFQSILHDEAILPLREYMSTNDGNSLFSNHVPNNNVEIELNSVRNISWVSDDEYITNGVNGDVPSAQTYYPDFSEFTTVRYFPDSLAKNCYRFAAMPNLTYVIRGIFFYGSYDNATKLPSFQMAIDGTVVANVTFDDPTIFVYHEITFMTQLNKPSLSGPASHLLNTQRSTDKDAVGHLPSLMHSDVEIDLTKYLGGGSSGTVFKCKFLGVLAAAKVFDGTDTQLVKAVEAEAKIFASLQHPNVVRFIGYAIKGTTQHILVSELMSMDLFKYLKEQGVKFAKQQVQPTLYSYNVLKVATKDFHPNNKLGQGGFGVVYKGILSDGTTVAVKHLTKSQQGVDDFLNEVIVITGVRHRNLVKLKGCCVHGTQRFLVFEYMENNNLAEALWDQQGQQTLLLDWPKRLNICVGVARGLAYLHEDSQPRIIHRDIKATNILLDKNMNAKIADFGLARLFPDDQSHVSTQIAGTIGYLAPEYATLGQLTPKADVYSFGILLLEIVSGRKNIDSTLASNKIYLIKWALFLYESNILTNLVEETLDIINSENEVRRVINVALLCVQIEPTIRPLMSHVLAMLQGEMGIDVNFIECKLHGTNPNFQSILDDQSNLPLCENMSINDGNILFTNHVPNSNAEIELSDLQPK